MSDPVAQYEAELERERQEMLVRRRMLLTTRLGIGALTLTYLWFTFSPEVATGAFLLMWSAKLELTK